MLKQNNLEVNKTYTAKIWPGTTKTYKMLETKKWKYSDVLKKKYFETDSEMQTKLKIYCKWIEKERKLAWNNITDVYR